MREHSKLLVLFYKFDPLSPLQAGPQSGHHHNKYYVQNMNGIINDALIWHAI